MANTKRDKTDVKETQSRRGHGPHENKQHNHRPHDPPYYDPVFWMHHCEIDRIWAAWQAATPRQHPTLAGSAAIMDLWSETEVDTHDITALGYSYV